MDICPKDEPTGKNLVCKKGLPISEKNWKNLLGGGGGGPPPLGHRRVKVTGLGTLHNLAENGFRTEIFLHFLQIDKFWPVCAVFLFYDLIFYLTNHISVTDCLS